MTATQGEAEITINGTAYPVRMNMGALARMGKALGVKTQKELGARILEFRLDDMPLVVDAALKANGHVLSEVEVGQMDPADYFDKFLPLMFKRAEPKDGEEASSANPPQSQATSPQ